MLSYWKYFGYIALSNILKLISLFYFYFLKVLLEHLSLYTIHIYVYIWIIFVAPIILLLGNSVLDPSSAPQLFGNLDWRWPTEGNAKLARASHSILFFLLDVHHGKDRHFWRVAQMPFPYYFNARSWGPGTICIPRHRNFKCLVSGHISCLKQWEDQNPGLSVTLCH